MSSGVVAAGMRRMFAGNRARTSHRPYHGSTPPKLRTSMVGAMACPRPAGDNTSSPAISIIRHESCCFAALLFYLRVGVSDTDDCGRGNLYFDLNRNIVADGLCVAAEITEDCRRRNGEDVALGTDSEVKNAISSNGTCRDACIGDDIEVRVTCYSRFQYGCREAPIGVSSRVHIDGGPYRRETSTVGREISLGGDGQRVRMSIGRAHHKAAARDALHRADEGDAACLKDDRGGSNGWRLSSGWLLPLR